MSFAVGLSLALAAAIVVAIAVTLFHLLRPPPFRSGGDQALVPLADGVFVYRGHFANSGVLVLADRVVVIDTQVTPLGAQRLKAAIAKVTRLPVTHVINTHYHGDHVGGNSEFPGAEIVANAQTARFIRERDGERVEYARTFGLEFGDHVHPIAPPTRTFDRALTLSLAGETLELLTLGEGETPDATVVWVASRRVLFAGDSVAPAEYPWTGVPFLDEGLRPDGEWVRLLERLRRLRPELLIAGHGPPLVGAEVIDERLSMLASLFTDLFDVTRDELRRGGGTEAIVACANARLRHYAERADMKERVLCQRFALYKALNGLLPERRGRGWWDDLRPSVVHRVPLAEALAFVGDRSELELRRAAAKAARSGQRPLAITALESWLELHPDDARVRGLLSDILIDGAFETTPFVDAMEFVALATHHAKSALAKEPDDALALLTLGCAEVWGAMVLAQPMDAGIAHLERALWLGGLTRWQRGRAHFFLGKAHQMDFRDAESDRHYRQLLPGPARVLFGLLRTRLRTTP